jgi:hypothetical protein
VAKDMIAVRIAPDIPMAIVGSPQYFRRHPPPSEPQHLVEHRCINLRLPTSATLNRWRLLQNGRDIRVRVDGPLICKRPVSDVDRYAQGINSSIRVIGCPSAIFASASRR